MRHVTTRNPGPSQATTQRVLVEPSWPYGGMVTKNMADRTYDVQQYTGYSYSNVPGAQFDRGALYRFNTPVMQPPPAAGMWDPTQARVVYPTGKVR